MYMINLIIIYDMVNMFCMKKYKSLRKLRVGVNRYMGVNWSTTTTDGHNGEGQSSHVPVFCVNLELWGIVVFTFKTPCLCLLWLYPVYNTYGIKLNCF